MRFLLDGASSMHHHLHYLFTYSYGTIGIFFHWARVPTSGFIQSCGVDPASYLSVLSSFNVVFLICADDVLVKRLSLEEAREGGELVFVWVYWKSYLIRDEENVFVILIMLSGYETLGNIRDEGSGSVNAYLEIIFFIIKP